MDFWPIAISPPWLEAPKTRPQKGRANLLYRMAVAPPPPPKKKQEKKTKYLCIKHSWAHPNDCLMVLLFFWSVSEAENQKRLNLLLSAKWGGFRCFGVWKVWFRVGRWRRCRSRKICRNRCQGAIFHWFRRISWKYWKPDKYLANSLGFSRFLVRTNFWQVSGICPWNVKACVLHSRCGKMGFMAKFRGQTFSFGPVILASKIGLRFAVQE